MSHLKHINANTVEIALKVVGVRSKPKLCNFLVNLITRVRPCNLGLRVLGYRAHRA